MNDKIAELRNAIDQQDELLWSAIGKRMELVKEIGEQKRQEQISVVQPQRYAEVLAHCKEVAARYQLPPELVEEIMDMIHQESIRVES